jgi:2-dehydro-3-deoxyphosphogluconate aldolase/(4S)-4-hydroxy-2-oxoglutarate aldolase
MSGDDIFEGHTVMAVLRNHSIDDTVRLTNTALDLGITLIEVPIQTPDAVPALEAAIAAARERGAGCGAGTITTVDQVELCVRLGASFTVAPGFDRPVVTRSQELALPHLPGVATASEIQAAVSAGCRWLKAFPASLLTPGWFQAMKTGPFPQVSLLASGGISALNAEEFLSAGAAGVAVGSALEDPDQLAQLSRLIESHA